MAILGRLDASTFANTVAVTQNSATVTKNAADEIDQGDIIELGGVPYLVKQVNTTTQITLHTEYAAADNATLAGAVRRTAPKAVAEYIIKGGDSASYELLFVDNTEQAVSANKSRGIWGPGWWKYRTYTDASGSTRHKAECIAALQATAAVAGDDADDAIISDIASTIALVADWATGVPAITPVAAVGNVVTLSEATHNGVNIVVDANAIVDAGSSVLNGGTLTFQWQRQKTSSGRWANVTDALDGGTFYTGMAPGVPVLTILGAQVLEDAGVDGYEFRVKVTSTSGAEEVISPDLSIVVGA